MRVSCRTFHKIYTLKHSQQTQICIVNNLILSLQTAGRSDNSLRSRIRAVAPTRLWFMLGYIHHETGRLTTIELCGTRKNVHEQNRKLSASITLAILRILLDQNERS